MTNDDEKLAGARAMLDAGDLDGALKVADEMIAAHGGRPPAGVHLLRARVFKQQRSLAQFHALEAELLIDPGNAGARQHLARITAQFTSGLVSPADRKWQVGMPDEAIKMFELASQRHTYRGMPMIKNCFDLALYPMLLHAVRPATIIEIGTLYGASAVWFSDLTRTFGLDTEIYSIDVSPMPLMQAQRVTFMRGSGRELGAVLSADFLDSLARPLLVIEDADHEYPTTLAVLNFFHPVMRPGEYVVVEDGMTCPGTRQALVDFMKDHPADYDIDSNYCDFFGYNLTWCVNGFLRRK